MIDCHSNPPCGRNSLENFLEIFWKIRLYYVYFKKKKIMSTSNETDRSATAMDELLDELEQISEQTKKHVKGYRQVLGNLEDSTLSWEEPQPDNPQACNLTNDRQTYLKRFLTLIEDLQASVHKQTEMLEHYRKII